MAVDPEVYDSWYNTARGGWITEQEFSTLVKLFPLKEGQRLLDVGCGSGQFSQRFSRLGLKVTGLDADENMIDFAKEKYSDINFMPGDALELPFADNSFDYCSAITSLCFVSEPEKALAEMLRVSRKGVMLGLLNRHSLLFYQKRDSVGYQGARWDTVFEIKQWCQKLKPEVEIMTKSAVWIPSAGIIARLVEPLLPKMFPYGSFIAASIKKSIG